MTAESVIKTAAEKFGVTVESIKREGNFRRTSQAVMARGAVIYILRSQRMKLIDIAAELGYKDHTGALNLLCKTERRLLDDIRYSAAVREVKGAA